MIGLVLALGLAVLFQFILVRIKWNRGDYADVFVDMSMLLLLNAIFSGTILGVLSATAGSTLISLYLLYKPITLLSPEASNNFSSKLTEESLKKARANLEEIFK